MNASRARSMRNAKGRPETPLGVALHIAEIEGSADDHPRRTDR